MGNASTRCPLGLLKLAQICHKIFSRLLSLWDEGDEFSKSDDTFFKGYDGIKERKKVGSLYDIKMQGPGKVGRKKGGSPSA